MTEKELSYIKKDLTKQRKQFLKRFEKFTPDEFTEIQIRDLDNFINDIYSEVIYLLETRTAH